MLSVEQMKKVCELRAKLNERVPVTPISVGEAKDALIKCEWNMDSAEKMLKTKHGILDDYGNWELTLVANDNPIFKLTPVFTYR